MIIELIVVGLACLVTGAYLENKFGAKVVADLPGLESRLKADAVATEARLKADAIAAEARAKTDLAALKADILAEVSKLTGGKL
jgi:hypothetical protein